MKKIIIPILCVLSLIACNKTTQKSEQTNEVAQEVKTVERGITKGFLYTDIQAMQNDNTPLALSQFVGKTDYVLVDFWASWCGPCRRSLPILKDIYQSMPEGRLEIFGVSVDKDAAEWQKAVQEEGLTWPQARDIRQEPYNPGDVYQVQYIPMMVLIDKQGMIVAVNPEEEELRTILAK